jgi:hypothetical protein
MELNGGGVAMDSEERDDCHEYCTVQSHRKEKASEIGILVLGTEDRCM